MGLGINFFTLCKYKYLLPIFWHPPRTHPIQVIIIVQIYRNQFNQCGVIVGTNMQILTIIKGFWNRKTFDENKQKNLMLV